MPGQKRVLRPKVEPDPAREELEARCVEAVKIVRKVYVRHPNYGDLVRGLDAGGLDGLDERVPVSVGRCLSSKYQTNELMKSRYSAFPNVGVYNTISQ